MMLIKLEDINKAYKKIRSDIIYTPLITNEYINDLLGSNIYFKLENLQTTGSFKLRGATNKILNLTDKEKNNGIIAYSSGNHAQAVAYAALKNNIKAEIVMPNDAPKIKLENTEKYGAKIIKYNPLSESRESIAEQISKTKNKKIIKPYDDLDIISGQGTVGKEIVLQLEDINVVPDIYICCCGGGGLISGSSFYLKSIYPNIKNFSVEPLYFNDTQLSIKKNKIISNKNNKTSICDALLASQPGNLTFQINQQTLDGCLTVSDENVKKSILILSEELKIIAEPGGAVAAAAIFFNKIDIKNKNVIVMISGGNIDYDLFRKIIKN